MAFFENENDFFFKIAKCGNFAVECVSNFPENVFSTLIVSFFVENQKCFEFGKKNRTFDEEREYCDKNAFNRCLKAIFTKIRRRKICR